MQLFPIAPFLPLVVDLCDAASNCPNLLSSAANSGDGGSGSDVWGTNIENLPHQGLLGAQGRRSRPPRRRSNADVRPPGYR
jgi:hypothetical protein